jgi:hypothetical protein
MKDFFYNYVKKDFDIFHSYTHTIDANYAFQRICVVLHKKSFKPSEIRTDDLLSLRRA